MADRCKVPCSRHSPNAMTAHPSPVAASDAAGRPPATARKPRGIAAKLSAVSAHAVAIDGPKGCTLTAIATCARGTRLETAIAAAHPIAAPVIPIRGISSRSTPMLTPIASNPLTRLQPLLPVVISTVSTCPQAVATSMASARMTMTVLPVW